MRALVLVLLALALAGCQGGAEVDSKDTYLNAGSAEKGTNNQAQLEKMGMDPNSNMAGDTGSAKSENGR